MIRKRRRQTFKYNHDQTQISQLHNGIFEGRGEPFRSRRAPSNANEDLADEAAVQRPIERRVDEVQGQEQRGEDEYVLDPRLVVWQGGSHVPSAAAPALFFGCDIVPRAP